jgi:hypothetical protein
MIRSITRRCLAPARQIGQQADVERREQPRFVAWQRIQDAARTRDAGGDLRRGARGRDAARDLEAELALQTLADAFGDAEAVAAPLLASAVGSRARRADLDEHRIDRRPLDRGAAPPVTCAVAQDLVDRRRGFEVALDGAVEERRVRDSAPRRSPGSGRAGRRAARPRHRPRPPRRASTAARR